MSADLGGFFILGFVGLLVYALDARKKISRLKQAKDTCPNCGDNWKRYFSDDMKCDTCGFTTRDHVYAIEKILYGGRPVYRCDHEEFKHGHFVMQRADDLIQETRWNEKSSFWMGCFPEEMKELIELEKNYRRLKDEQSRYVEASPWKESLNITRKVEEILKFMGASPWS